MEKSGSAKMAKQTMVKKQIEPGSKTEHRVTRKRANSGNCLPFKEPEIKKQRRSMPVAGNPDSGIKSIAVLPTEMLEAILKNVTTLDLLHCRQVNHQWNVISSEILRKRADISLHFEFVAGTFVQTIKKMQSVALMEDVDLPVYSYGLKRLTDLTACLKESDSFPFSNFQFDCLSKIGSRDMRHFISMYGNDILTLKIIVDDPVTYVGMLKELIFEKVPNLKKLEIEFHPRFYNFRQRVPSSVRLFPGSDKLKLPKLEVLCVSNGYGKFRHIIEDILAAAPNLKRFVGLLMEEYIGITAEDMEMLQSLGKFHCLKDLQINVSEELIRFWKDFPMTMDLKLQSLRVSVETTIGENHELKSKATEIVNRLLHSSKDVLHTLFIEHLALISGGLVIPRLENLQALSLNYNFDEQTTFTVLSDLADKFPNMKTLDIDLDEYFLFIQHPVTLPSVEILRIWNGSSEVNTDFMMAFPNVKTLTLIDDQTYWPGLNAIFNFEGISKNWPKLENLGWKISTGNHRHLMYKLDAATTGLPESFCRKLSEKLRWKTHLPAAEATDYQSKRRKSSILDLKELKTFDVVIQMDEHNCICGCVCGHCYTDCDSDCEHEQLEIDQDDDAGFGTESIFHRTGFTKVSKFVAFDQMPNLKIQIEKRFD